jgi:hypothetical protein
MFWFAAPIVLFTEAGRREYLTCRNCGTVLRIIGQRKSIWVFFYGTVAILAVFAFSYKRLFGLMGFGATALYWAILIFLIVYVFNYGMWKNAILTRADTGTSSK